MKIQPQAFNCEEQHRFTDLRLIPLQQGSLWSSLSSYSKESSLCSPAFDNYLATRQGLLPFTQSFHTQLFWYAYTHPEIHIKYVLNIQCDFWLHVGCSHLPMSKPTTPIIKKNDSEIILTISQVYAYLHFYVCVCACVWVYLSGPFPHACSHGGTNAPSILFPTSQTKWSPYQPLCEPAEIK